MALACPSFVVLARCSSALNVTSSSLTILFIFIDCVGEVVFGCLIVNYGGRRGCGILPILLTMNWGVTKSQVCVLPPQLNAICLGCTYCGNGSGWRGGLVHLRSW